MNRQLGGQLRGSNSPKLLAARLKPQTRYNRNAVLLPMASIRNTRLTSSKLDDIQFWMKRISKTAGIGTKVDRLITGSVSSSKEASAASSLLMANVTGLRPAEK
jgi:hypothetical protein